MRSTLKTAKDWLNIRWLELRLGWLSIKKARLEYELLKLHMAKKNVRLIETGAEK